MALSFPPSPAIGDIYLNWQWNGSAWGPIPGGSSGGSVSITAGTGVTVSPSPLTGTGTVALANIAANSLKGNNTGAAAAAADLTVAQAMTMLGAAPLASPAFTGTPSLPTGTTAVTQAAATNNTSLATTAFVKSQAYLIGNQTITLSGDVTGSGTTAITTTLTTVPISKGGSGQTAIPAAFTALAASGGTVGGNLSVTGSVTATGPIETNGATSGFLFKDQVTNAVWDWYANNSSAFLWTATQGNRLKIDLANGLVTFSGNLYVQPASGNNAQLDLVSSFPRRYQIYSDVSNGAFGVYDQTGAASRLVISTTGACSASSTWAVISDARLKEDVQPYTRGLAEILPLEPIMFRWTGGGGVPADGELHYGLAAQQVEEHLPELIREHAYVPPEGAREGDAAMVLKTYSPTDLTFALINACKELHERLTAAEAKLTSQGMKH